VENRATKGADPDDRAPRGPYGGAMHTRERPQAAPPDTPFGAVLCVTDGSEAGAEAVRQAALLAGDGVRLERLTVTSEDPMTVLHRCEGHDLLALPAGPLARQVLPRADIPVLVARRTPDLFASVLVAVDGTPEAHAAALVGARLAARERAELALVAAPEHDALHQRALLRDAAAVERVIGRRPLILDEHGAPVPSIVGAAALVEASLIVLGSRPRHPAGSVSAEVAERASCSVLVLRPRSATVEA
jgi:nucleotide-binding universal stress UspA family protein